MGILRVIVGVASELFIFKDPYQTCEPPCIVSETKDACGRVVSQRVRASSGTESTRHLQGITVQGERSIVSTHRTDIRRGLFDVHVEDWKSKT